MSRRSLPPNRYATPVAWRADTKLTRTIADLAGAADIEPAHLAEAIQYRSRRVEWSAEPVGVSGQLGEQPAQGVGRLLRSLGSSGRSPRGRALPFQRVGDGLFQRRRPPGGPRRGERRLIQMGARHCHYRFIVGTVNRVQNSAQRIVRGRYHSTKPGCALDPPLCLGDQGNSHEADGDAQINPLIPEQPQTLCEEGFRPRSVALIKRYV